MGCTIRRLPRSAKLALTLQWMAGGHSVRCQESMGVSDTPKNRDILERDYAAPIRAEMRARRFDGKAYLSWFPAGSRAAEFRKALGIGAVKAKSEALPTVADYYRTWIERQKPPHVRRSRGRDYRQHMTAYVLPELGDHIVAELTVGHLHQLRDRLGDRGLSAKTIRNVVGGTLRAFYRDAKLDGLASADLFAALSWPRLRRVPADPFTAEERDQIIGYFAGGHYGAFMHTLFMTGLRPSEAVALRVGDIHADQLRLTVARSRYMRDEAATKTAASERTIDLAVPLAYILEPLLAGRRPDEYLFVDMRGNPVHQGNWGKTHWKKCLTALGIRYRRWYSTRHTFISLALTSGANVFGLARYAGTSVQMIEARYGRYMPADGREIVKHIEAWDGAKTRPVARVVALRSKKLARIGTSPTGFELVSGASRVIPIPSRNGKQINCLLVRRGWGSLWNKRAS